MRGRANKPKQSAFVFRSWGGRRRGAGRKPTHEKAGTPHLTRPTLTGRHPLHLTLRPRQGVWNLRSKRCFQVIGQALLGLQGRGDLRVVHYSVQGNHLHLIAEAADKAALCAGAKSLAVRLAMKLNRLMGTRGAVFLERYHVHVLRSPSEVRRALSYVLGNFASHARRRGEAVPAEWGDPFTSAAVAGGESPAAATGQGMRWGPPAWFTGLERLVSAPRTWLLRTAAA